MIKDGLWLRKQRKRATIHQSRPRRPRLGELVQIDGSPHDWFEGRAPRCTLIVFIGDATSRLYVQDVRANKCSCIIYTSAIHGGRMPVLQEQKPVCPCIFPQQRPLNRLWKPAISSLTSTVAQSLYIAISTASFGSIIPRKRNRKRTN